RAAQCLSHSPVPSSHETPPSTLPTLPLHDALPISTMAIMIATALHTIAFGNMLPAYSQDENGEIRPIATIAVDSSEFVVSKLKRSEEHTSELQSRENLVCRLLLEKKNPETKTGIAL